MKIRLSGIALSAAGLVLATAAPAAAQCCLNGLFGACCAKPPVYAVAPVAAPVAAPIVAPVVAPVPAPPPPVMVPVQQTSYVPETTYRTQYQNVPVTSYKPSCEIDPCTGCPRECMQPVTEYVQQAVNVPVTQYRAVTTTKYVQMQPGYAGGYPAAGQGMAAPGATAVPAAPAASPFAAPVQTTPQAWGAAGPDIPQQLVPGTVPPALPPAAVPQQTYQQPITPQSGVSMPSYSQAIVQPQPVQPPALAPTPAAPTPSLKPIPEVPRATAPSIAPPSLAPATGTTAPAPLGGYQPGGGAVGGSPAAAPSVAPVAPSQGPKVTPNSYPRLLDPSSHTTSWRPAMFDAAPIDGRAGYPTAALPSRLQQ